MRMRPVSRFCKILICLELIVLFAILVIDFFAVGVVFFVIIFQIVPTVLFSTYAKRRQMKGSWKYELGYFMVFSLVLYLFATQEKDRQVVVVDNLDKYIIFLDAPVKYVDTLKIDASGIGFSSLSWEEWANCIKILSNDSTLTFYSNRAENMTPNGKSVTAIYAGNCSKE